MVGGGFLAWRKRHPALIHGDLRLIAVPDPLVAFERRTEGQCLLAVFNLSDREVVVPRLLRPSLRPLQGHGFAHHSTGADLILPAHGVLFAEDMTVSIPAPRILEPAE